MKETRLGSSITEAKAVESFKKGREGYQFEYNSEISTLKNTLDLCSLEPLVRALLIEVAVKI